MPSSEYTTSKGRDHAGCDDVVASKGLGNVRKHGSGGNSYSAYTAKLLRPN